MPGGRDPVGGGVQATDNGRGTHLSGATEGTGTVQGVRVGDSGWIKIRRRIEFIIFKSNISC